MAPVPAGFLLITSLAVTGISQAQTMGQQAAGASPDQSLTIHGVTLYGIIDIGLQYDTHAAPISDYFPAGSAEVIQKNGNHSVTGATPSNMSQSRVGLQGLEPLPGMGDWAAVFKLETFFNPQSGDISDGLKSLAQNNGKALTAQGTNVDTSVAGQAFQQLFLGLASPTYGSLTFGRQNTLLADAIAKYDPQGASQAFSVIGFSGTAAGAGDTEDRRLDSSLKYALQTNGVHFGVQYKFNGATGSANSAVEAQLGGDYAGLSVDAYYVKVKDAVAAGALSAAQVAELPVLGYPVSSSLTGTISDNTTYGLMGLYSVGTVKLFAAYEHIQYANPAIPLAAGFNDIGGYTLAFVNNAAYNNDKILQVYWAGVKYTIANVDLTAAYYGYKQNSYATGADAGCSTTLSGACSGNLNAVSFSADYRLTKRFDMYAGLMWTGVQNGLASGYLYKNNVDPTIGGRFKF
jgi:predicted porin